MDESTDPSTQAGTIHASVTMEYMHPITRSKMFLGLKVTTAAGADLTTMQTAVVNAQVLGGLVYDQLVTLINTLAPEPTVAAYEPEPPDPDAEYAATAAGHAAAAPTYRAVPAQDAGMASPATYATEKQVKAIYAIARATRGWGAAAVAQEVLARYNSPPEQLGKAEASQFIDSLKATS